MPSGVFSLKQVNRALIEGAWSNQKPLNVDYLVVAGGGGGSGYTLGGGGAGGLLQGNISVAAGSAITVTVGGGGAGSSGTATSGSSSVFGSITTTGGGGGASTSGVSGGSGGGVGNGGAAGSGIFGQGNAGAKGGVLSGGNAGGGGGGAGTVGLSPAGSFAGGGGAGIASDISGTRTAYAGGGAGGNNVNNNAGNGGTGGVGGGGNGTGNGNGSPGTANTGGGGGAGNSTGGAGGSGIVILSYPDIYQAAASTTGSPTVSTSGSGSLSASNGNYLYSSSSTNLALGTSSFTVEYWVNITNVNTSNQVPVCLGTTNYSPLFGYVSSGLKLFLSSTGSSWDVASNVTIGTVSSGVWHHVAIVRNGNTFYTFLDGVQGATFTNSGSIYQNNNTMGIGTGENNAYPFTGYVTNVRLLKGTALYTANFTPPTTPLTAITNTQLLFSSVSGSPFTDSSANALTFTRTGSPSWNQLSPFATGLGYKNRVYTWTSSGSITF